MKSTARGRWIVLGLMLVLAAILSGCGELADWFGDNTVSENHDASRHGTAQAEVEADQVIMLVVKSQVGTVEVKPGQGDAVVVGYRLTAYGDTDAEAEAELANMDVVVTPNGDRVLVDATKGINPAGSSRSNKIDLVIEVPEQVDLDVTNSVGDVTIRQISAPSRLKVNVSVGRIVLDEVESSAPADIHCDTGDIRFDGSLAAGQAHTITTSVGSIRVTLPGDTAAALDVVAEVGSIESSGFALDGASQRDGVHAELHGTLGEGGEPITLATGVGDIRIEQS